MPYLRGSRFPLLSPEGIKYILCDKFITTAIAGAIPLAAEPGPGTRLVTDSLGTKVLIPGGYVSLIGRNNINDCLLSYPAITRVPGKIFITSGLVGSAATSVPGAEYSASATSQPGTTCGILHNGELTVYDGADITVGPTLTNGVYYKFCTNSLTSGALFFIKGGIQYPYWTLVYVGNKGTTATLYPMLRSYYNNQETRYSLAASPIYQWLPSPLAYLTGAIWPITDGYAGDGGYGAGGSGLVFTDNLGTWGTNGTVINASALDGSGIAIATVSLNTANVWFSCVLGYSAGSAGVIVRYKDVANYVYVINDGTNVKLFEVTTAVPYPGTQRGTGIKAPAAGARLIVDVSGAVARVYYNGAIIFTYSSVADITAKTIGLITTNTANTFNNAAAYAKGTGGEYTIFDRFSES